MAYLALKTGDKVVCAVMVKDGDRDEARQRLFSAMLHAWGMTVEESERRPRVGRQRLG